MESKKKPIRSFEDLDVFEKAYQVSLDVHRVSLQFPKIEQYSLGSQVRRAGKSICANIAEGYGKSHGSGAEFKRYLQMAVGSAEEMQVWIRYCLDLGYIDDEKSIEWREAYKEIAKMLNGLYKVWR